MSGGLVVANDPVNMVDPNGKRAITLGRLVWAGARGRGLEGARNIVRETKVDWNTMNAGTTATLSQQFSAAADVLLGTDFLSEAEGQVILNENANELDRQARGLQKQADLHRQKLEDFKQDPDAHDNKGHLAKAGSDTAKRQKIIDGRIRNLEKQIDNFQNQADDAARAAEKLRDMSGG